MIKKVLLFFVFYNCVCYSQTKQDTNANSLQNGKYKSYLTSFKSEIDKTQNFKEKGEFNIIIRKDIITVQDFRIPNKKLIYKCFNTIKKVENFHFLDDCINEHLKDSTKSDIIFYKKNDRLNLMVSDKESSQVFFNLIKTTKK